MNDFTPISEILSLVIDDMEKAINSDHGYSGLSSGLKTLDQFVMGMNDGELITVAGQNNSGRDSLVRHIATNNAMKSDVSVLYVTLNDSPKHIVAKMVCALDDINTEEYAINAIKLISKEKMQIINKCNLSLSSASSFSDAIDIVIRFVYGSSPLNTSEKMIVIDGIDFYDANARANTAKLKCLARDIGAPILVSSPLNGNQLKRVNKRPLLSDISGSSFIEEISNTIILTYFDQELSGFNGSTEMEIQVIKNNISQNGLITVSYNEKTGKIKDL